MSRPTNAAEERSGAVPGADRIEGAATEGLYLYGVTRSRTWRTGARSGAQGVIRVRFRDLEALVRLVPYGVPDLCGDSLTEHQRVLEAAMRRGTVLPLPFGLVFRGRRAVVRFLEDQYVALDEGLAFLDGHWELRVHISGDPEESALRDLVQRIYTEMRRFSRAAIPLPVDGRRLLSAAFLVDRGAWIEFVEHTDDLNGAHPELTFDVTGPWPAYDFVRVLR